MNPFHYYSQYRVLVCKSCQYAIQPGRITTHLRSKQHKLSRSQAEEIANQYDEKELADPCTERIVPESIVQPIAHLPIYRDGLVCNHCHFICRSRDWMQRHQRAVHDIRVGRGRRSTQVEWTTTWCQCFFISVGQHYFPIRQTRQADGSPTETAARLLHLVHRQLDQKEKVIQEKRQLIRDAEDLTEVSPWLERTQWIRHLEGQDKALIVQLIKPAQVDEMELKEVEKSLKRLVETARQTILQRKISTFMLHRLESFHSGQDAAKPFHVNMNLQTIERYQRVWSQLLVYVLRTADSDLRLYQLKQDQRSCVQELLVAANRVLQYEEGELEEEEVEVMQKELDRSCLALCMALLDHRLNHDEYESAIISCLAIMGLEYIPGSNSTTQYKFKDSAQVTPILSGFIKITQMLTVQYCLEEEESNKVESCRELLEELHTRFLTVGTATPMDWVLRLRLYGRGIIKRLTAEGCINWIEDTVIYQDIELSMSDFRRLVHQLAEETRSVLMKDLLFVEGAERQLPTYSWIELKDNPAKDEPGWYFVCDRRNRMHEQGRWLLDRILQTSELADQFIHHSTGVWRQKRVNDYLDSISYFMEKLLILIHMTSGQPARSREWLSIRYCNTEKGGHRCIFVENGLLVVVTYYHKGYNITGTEKIIHRYLPQEVGELLLLYIWLVLPLRQQLQQLVFNDNEIPTAFLWSIDKHKKWTGDRVREVLKRESDRLIGVLLNKKSYRHIAIAISDRYMKRTKFDKEKDDEKRKNLNEDEEHDQAVAIQSGHTSETAGAIYARHLEEAPSHMQQMRYRFRVSSLEWHEVLQFASPLEGLESSKRKRLQKEEHEGSPGPRFRRWQALRQTNLQHALQRLMGPETRFRGKQHAALQAIVANKSPIILVMRTGGGKSLMFMLPASVQETGTTVVVTPLIALKQDMQRRCRELGLEVTLGDEWTVLMNSPRNLGYFGYHLYF